MWLPHMPRQEELREISVLEDRAPATATKAQSGPRFSFNVEIWYCSAATSVSVFPLEL